MINIAIDGLAGNGKSTLARGIAAKLGPEFKVLDTGAIFRSFAYACQQAKIKQLSEEAIEKLVNKTTVIVSFVEGKQHMFVNGKDVTGSIRTETISQLASKLSVFASVRNAYVRIAQQFARENDCIIEGQDIATVIMPDATLKIFLTADEKVRAQRRYDELIAKGEDVTYEGVLQGLRERYERDSERGISPLRPPEESVIVDNSDITLEETIDYCMELIRDAVVKDRIINIAIDGYVCSGKSSIAKELAKRIKFSVFDTGACYRGVAAAFEYMQLDESLISEEYIKKFAKQISLSIDFVGGVQHVYVNGIDYTHQLRTERISALTAKISPFTCIRDKVLKLQRSYAKNNNIVMEGRDIGSHVLPNADFKFFCTADEKVRAKRRFEQQKALGNDVTFAKVLKELQARDYADTHRDHGALVQLPESIVIDTTNSGLEQSVDLCFSYIKKGLDK